MVDVLASDVDVGRFFATADPPPNNVFMMCVRPRREGRHILEDKSGRVRMPNGQFVSAEQIGNNTGLCVNINDESYWRIDGNRYVRLIREDEYDKTEFHVGREITKRDVVYALAENMIRAALLEIQR
jgi:hypothetical protein